MAKARGKNEKAGNGFSGLALLITFAIIAAALLSLVALDAVFPFRRGMGAERMLFFAIGSLSFLIIAFSTILIYTYVKDYLELRSSFTLALLFAVVAFLMLGISSNPLIHIFFGVYGRQGFFSFLPFLFAAIALGILAWISRK
ncbi:MAG: hypothetical protein N3E51_05125 [Candidatus Micrarchaeota archaeon]|nr:hypothetical protein [Candidatus Micrarchaeota archaeon]